LLVLLTGRATRLARFVEQQSKVYLATARLGFGTTTDDRTGETVGAVRPVEGVQAGDVKAALTAMIGRQHQVPPAYSAKKVAGERSYRLARRGEAVPLKPVELTVEDIELVGFDPPHVTFRATVTAGTYIRAMARDLGERLGVGGHLESLRREAIGGLRVEAAVPLEEVREGTPLQPLRAVLAHLKPVELTEDELVAVSHGRPVRREPEGVEFVQLVREDRLVAVAREEGDQLQPVVVLEAR
jgi:tRNA pseudouridine55 synthase